MTTTATRRKAPTVPAREVTDHAGFFRKPGGEYVHLRLSESSVRYLKLDESKVYGVSYNGNVSVLDPEKQVVLCDVSDLAANVEKERQWEQAVGVADRRRRETVALVEEAILLANSHDQTLCQKLRDALRVLRD